MPELRQLQQFFIEQTPLPTPSMTVDPVLVTPGPAGFAAIAVLAVAVILLIIDMQRRIRRVRYRDEIAQQLDAQLHDEAEASEAITKPNLDESDGSAPRNSD